MGCRFQLVSLLVAGSARECNPAVAIASLQHDFGSSGPATHTCAVGYNSATIMLLPPGTRLGPYAITAQIGVGGVGEVYRATDVRIGHACLDR